MPVLLTKRRQELLDAMRAKAGTDGWEHVPDHLGYCIRWDRTLVTPGWVFDMAAYRNWDPTYQQHVFITMVTATSVLMSVHRAPWVNGQMGIDLTLKRAFEILADPASVLDRT